jgi:pyruvate-ferredoxin/flavodoxin oxidoreductase
VAERRFKTIDGNEATASVAHRTNEVIAIYPITPSSGMGELCDEWAVNGLRNIWGDIPNVVEMQSEGGAAGAVHGSLQAGALTTTFTASQGLLLMLPNMFKIAGELTSLCMHVAARSVSTHALSIFGDHTDVMACRQSGVALLASGSVQEAHDFAVIAQAATLRSRLPFLHFLDGFRTSHEVTKIEELTDDDLRHMIDDEAVAAHRARALTPDRPFIRGTAQNPDAMFQSREAVNPFYNDCPGIVLEEMKRFADLTGRRYQLFDYVGAPDAERVLIMMGSGAETVHETVEWLNKQGEKVGLIKVRLYRPFSIEGLAAALPKTVRAIAVLDRTKEPGAVGEPLYTDVVTGLSEGKTRGLVNFDGDPHIIGGRYGLSSKEFNPAMVKAVFDELNAAEPHNHFSVGIIDDVTNNSLEVDEKFDIEPDDVVRAMFFGLGADGTVGANKNSIKIIGEQTPNFAQGYFVYDSKKSGAVTISHLRFGPRPIRSTYLIRKASFVACHQSIFLDRFDMLSHAAPGAVFLLNSHFGPDEVWDEMPMEVQQHILNKKLKFYVIDAYKVAKELDLGQRINTIMQTCFFAISGVLPRDEAIGQIKKAIEKSYGKKGQEVVERNFEAVDVSLQHLHEVKHPGKITSSRVRPPVISDQAPDFVKNVTAKLIAGEGDLLPVSAFPVDGTYPSGTCKWEKRNIAMEIPVWETDLCIQCNKCAMVCPHAAIRAKVYEPGLLGNAPATFKSVDFKSSDFKGHKYTIQVAPEDCTGCRLCVAVCPAKDKNDPGRKAIDMMEQRPLREPERENYEFFLEIPEADRTKIKLDIKGSQFFQPLFEYSGACSGCGETAYVKLLTQLYGDRALIANATGCSSIFGGNLPTTPYTINRDGRGPAWSNSLFEDNAEFGFGFRLALDSHANQASQLLRGQASHIGETLVQQLLESEQDSEAEIHEQRQRVEELKRKLANFSTPEAKRLTSLADYLVRKSVWLVGGDGWAYDIGFGGLDHVMAMNRDINILVLDTEVYSNTGGQSSKATPLGASAKFAVAGKPLPKKDLGLQAMSYGNVYVARVAFGAKDAQTVRAFVEADEYRGTSLIIAYSTCIAHGYDLSEGAAHQKMAVDSGIWPLYRFDPRRIAKGEPPLQLDSGAPKVPVAQFMRSETRFRSVEKDHPERFKTFLEQAQRDVDRRTEIYKQLAAIKVPGNGSKES